MKNKLDNTMAVLIAVAIASVAVKVANWNALVGIALIASLLIGSMMLWVRVTIKIIYGGELDALIKQKQQGDGE